MLRSCFWIVLVYKSCTKNDENHSLLIQKFFTYSSYSLFFYGAIAQLVGSAALSRKEVEFESLLATATPFGAFSSAG